jgi:phosphoribosylformimino-5-aminoimidazole carboxamide ribotide isomerase
LKVIPVIDVSNGLVVHAVRGRRQEYQPLKSVLCDSVKPIEVAKVFKTLRFNELYVADLDAITRGKANFHMLEHIVDETGLRIIVDAGVAELETANQLLRTGVSKVIIGTETLPSRSFVGDAVRAFGAERVMVSLDLNGDKLLVKLGFAGCKDPMCLFREFREMGISSVIILDLTRVGSSEGVNLDFLKKALEEKVDVYVGGGVRDIKDLIELKNLGVSGALVASGLHSGKISIAELEQNGLL